MGVILYEGPSKLDGSPIVAIATGLRHPSRNEKTGDMIQTWIMRADVPPTEALRSGADESVCGRCIHRPGEDGRRSCYVQVERAPATVWRAYQAGRYPRVAPSAILGLGRGRKVRLGAYGDPAAVPRWVWRALTYRSAGWTGYTHSDPTGLGGLVMLSVDSPEEASDAAELGLRYFRVGAPGESPAPNEVLCPASREAQAAREARGTHCKVTCASCLLCDGTRPGDRRRSVFIPAHGSGARTFVRRSKLPVVAA